jgi:hypothetical protein
MGLKSLLGSKRTRQLSAATMFVQAALALKRGDVKTALLYAAGGVVSYKNTTVGFLSQIAIRLLRRGRGSGA